MGDLNLPGFEKDEPPAIILNYWYVFEQKKGGPLTRKEMAIIASMVILHAMLGDKDESNGKT